MRPLVVVLAFLVGCGLRTPASIEIDPALARQIPADAVALGGVKLDALRGNPLFQKWIAGRVDQPAQGVSEVVLASSGKDLVVLAKDKNPPPAGKGGIPPGLREKMRSIPPHAQVWAVGIGSGALPAAIPMRGNLANLQNLLNSIESWTAYAELGKELKLEASAVYRTEADATQIRDALKGLVAMGRITAPKDATELLQVFDAVQVSLEEKVVRVSATIPADLLDKALTRVVPNQR
jgi:hypothetical protein